VPGRALIVPMFDEERRIAGSLERIAASTVNDAALEVVLVDDGSSDRSAEVAAAAADRLRLRVRVLRLPSNQGKGRAVRAGMLATDAPVRVFVDADLSVDVKDIERCFVQLELGAADVVYGTRAHPESRLPRSQPPHRVLGGRAYNLLLRSLDLTTERDTQCGLKGCRAGAVQAVFEPMVTDGFAFDVEVLARARRAGLRVLPVPVTWSHVSESRVRPVRDGVRMGRAAFAIRRSLRGPDGGDPSAPTMAVDAFDAMARVERDHWWFRAKRRLVVDTLERHGVDRGPVVDVGAGTGGLLRELSASRSVVGLELDAHAIALARSGLPGAALARSVAERLPVRSGGASAVTALDVIEHLDDDVSALRELARVAGDGLVIVAVPAYRWAWSDHDVRLGHRRRYSRASLCEAAEGAGLEVVRATYFHSWLVPIAFLVRRTPLGRLLGGAAEEASFVNPQVNAVLGGVASLERGALRAIDLPFGLSILGVFRRPA
jgi:SAM-dependent methyltransferase